MFYFQKAFMIIRKNDLIDFKAGCFKISLKSKTPIVPVVLIDSYKPYNSWETGEITTSVYYLELIFYDEYKDMNTQQIAELVKSKIANKIEELEEAYKEGKVKAIGVSNFLIDDLQNILNNCEIKPMVNQVEAHICDVPFELAEFCKNNNILIEAYSPISHGLALQSEKIKEIADKYKVSVAQLCIRYTLELGFVTLPKTVHEEYMKSNADINFEISKEDMAILNGVKML